MSTNLGISVVLYGEAGCGKSTNAARIAKALNLTSIIEYEELYHSKHTKDLQRELPPFGVLLITNIPNEVIVPFPRLAYDHAMAVVNIFEANRGEAA